MFRRYFFAGLLIWLPIWASLVVLRFLIEMMDSSLALLPRHYRPEALFGFPVPGLGVLLSLVVIFFTGMLVTNLFGRRLVALWDRLLARIPVVRTVHTAVKQVLETVLSSGGQSFRQVLLVEYPRKGLWAIAFQTAEGKSSLTEKFDEPLLSIFVPTTPNPTSGFLMMIPEKDTIKLDISVDEALKMVISLGVVQPKPHETSAGSPT